MAHTLNIIKLLQGPLGSRLMSSGGKSSVGVIGLGNMGRPMAKNLLKNNFPVVVYDVANDSMQELKKAGAQTATTPADLASKVDIVLTMLPTHNEVLSCYTGPSGVLEGAKKSSILVDSSTVDPQVAQTVSAATKKTGATFVDAPVSGGTIGAEAGTLTFMVGGEESSYNTIKPVLQAMGANLVYCGQVGSGQAAKICNNMLLGITMLGVSEALNLGRELGLDPKLLTGIINSSTGRCWSSEKYNPVPGVMEGVPSANKYQGGFQSQLMCKDLGLAQDISTRLKCPIPLGAATHQFYRMINRLGDGNKDFAYVYQYLQGSRQ